MRTAAATVTSLLLAGCTTAGYHATKVEPLPDGLKGHVSGTGAVFEVDTLRVVFYNGDMARQGEAMVPPDVPFDLVLDGFARGPRKLPAVTLRIQRRSWRSIEHIWPLEILLLPLSVP